MYKAIAIDQTEYWVESFRKEAGKIYQVCVFNSNEVTHCCDIRPSYYLIPLYSYCENDISDELDEEILENDSLEPFYMYCGSVDTYKAIDCGDFESEEEAIDYLKGNCPI